MADHPLGLGTVDPLRNITIILIVLSFLVLGGGLAWLHYYVPDKQAPVILDADWDVIEAAVENDIGLVGYQFLTHGSDIPTLEAGEYENCFHKFADLKTVGPEYTREYLFKYNEIVRIRMMHAGIDCGDKE